jgi:hypothetical protein
VLRTWLIIFIAGYSRYLAKQLHGVELSKISANKAITKTSWNPELYYPVHKIVPSNPVTNQTLKQNTILKQHWTQRYTEGAAQEPAGFSIRAANHNLKYQAKTT